MSWSHRFLAAIFVASVAASQAAAGPVAENFQVQRLADGVYAVIRQDPPGMMCDGNSGFIVDKDGVMIGAMGVSGSSVESDHAVCEAGVLTLGVSDLPEHPWRT